MVWGALGVFGAISTAVNYAWGVEKQRSFWKHKLFSFVMLLVAGLILLIALLLVSASQVVERELVQRSAPRVSGAPRAAQLHHPPRHHAPLHPRRRAGVLLRAEREGAVPRRLDRRARHRDCCGRACSRRSRCYVRDMTRFTRVNGSIAVVVVFLVWVYLQAVILLYGVEFTAAYASAAGRRKPAADARTGQSPASDPATHPWRQPGKTRSACEEHSRRSAGSRRARCRRRHPVADVICATASCAMPAALRGLVAS